MAIRTENYAIAKCVWQHRLLGFGVEMPGLKKNNMKNQRVETARSAVI